MYTTLYMYALSLVTSSYSWKSQKIRKINYYKKFGSYYTFYLNQDSSKLKQ